MGYYMCSIIIVPRDKSHRGERAARKNSERLVKTLVWNGKRFCKQSLPTTTSNVLSRLYLGIYSASGFLEKRDRFACCDCPGARNEKFENMIFILTWCISLEFLRWKVPPSLLIQYVAPEGGDRGPGNSEGLLIVEREEVVDVCLMQETCVAAHIESNPRIYISVLAPALVYKVK